MLHIPSITDQHYLISNESNENGTDKKKTNHDFNIVRGSCRLLWTIFHEPNDVVSVVFFFFAGIDTEFYRANVSLWREKKNAKHDNSDENE